MENPIKFGQEVLKELKKVTWPTRKETKVTTVMVLVMVAVAAIFFLLVDRVVASIVKMLLGWV